MSTTRIPTRNPDPPTASLASPATHRPALLGRTAARLVLLLAVAAAASGIATLVPGLLAGTAVMNGSARGTAVGVLVLALPTLLLGRRLALRGVPAGLFLLLGATAHLVYNAVLFCFATPFNPAFPAYVAQLGLGIATLVAALAGLVPAQREHAFTPPRSLAGFAVYLWVVAGLNVLAWLRVVLPAVLHDDRSFLAGSGLTTSPLYVQDLAFWLPVPVLVGVWLWRTRHPGRHATDAWAGLLGGAVLTFWVLEAFGVALDQWLGHRADPASDWATLAGSLMFVVLGLVSGTVLARYLHAYAAHR